MSIDPVPQLVRAQDGDSWLVGGGEMGAAVRAYDWNSTPLGSLSSWPQSLRITLGLCLNSRFPMFVWWGPKLINFYNDAYIPILGKRHPGALGRSAPEIWRDVWPEIASDVEAVFTRGEASWHERVLLVTNRNGYDEKAYFTYSHSAVFDAAGQVGGLICIVTEETHDVLLEERKAFLLGLSDRLRVLSEPQAIMDAAVEAIGRHLGASRVGYGHVQPDDKTIALHSSFTEGVVPLTGVFRLDGF